jgi:hypothetical protein
MSGMSGMSDITEDKIKAWVRESVQTYMDNIKDSLLVMLIGFIEQNRAEVEEGRPPLYEQRKEEIERLVRRVEHNEEGDDDAEEGDDDAEEATLQITPDEEKHDL